MQVRLEDLGTLRCLAVGSVHYRKDGLPLHHALLRGLPHVPDFLTPASWAPASTKITPSMFLTELASRSPPSSTPGLPRGARSHLGTRRPLHRSRTRLVTPTGGMVWTGLS